MLPVRESYKPEFYVRNRIMQHKSQSRQASTISDRARFWSVSVDCDFGGFRCRLEGVVMVFGADGEAGSMVVNGRMIFPERVMELDLYIESHIAV